MFSKMRKDAKAALKEKKMTYGQLSAVTGLSLSCGRMTLKREKEIFHEDDHS